MCPADNKNQNKLNGVNSLDISRFQQHLMGNVLTNPWQLAAADVNGDNVINSMDMSILQDPSLARAQLLQNYPNPFLRQTTIGFVLPEACEAQLRIVDAGGRVVAERRNQYPAGRHAEVFDLDVAPGVLYYELTTPWGRMARKMTVVAE